MLALAVVAIGLTPFTERVGIVVDAVDQIEVNHFYDDQGRLVFDQVIFYDWCNSQCRYQVRAWRLLKSDSQIPLKNFTTGRYEVIWHDGDAMRRVEAKAFYESWTQHDPEISARHHHPKNLRSGLLRLRETE